MKKWIGVIACVLILVCLTGCKKEKTQAVGGSAPRVTPAPNREALTYESMVYSVYPTANTERTARFKQLKQTILDIPWGMTNAEVRTVLNEGTEGIAGKIDKEDGITSSFHTEKYLFGYLTHDIFLYYNGTLYYQDIFFMIDESVAENYESIVLSMTEKYGAPSKNYEETAWIMNYTGTKSGNPHMTEKGVRLLVSNGYNVINTWISNDTGIVLVYQSGKDGSSEMIYMFRYSRQEDSPVMRFRE